MKKKKIKNPLIRRIPRELLGDWKKYLVVALTVRDENTLLRELRPLQAIRDHYPKIILTMDEEPEEQYEGIRRINARDWLLGIVD